METTRRDFFGAIAGALLAFRSAQGLPAEPSTEKVQLYPYSYWHDAIVNGGEDIILSGHIDRDADFVLERAAIAIADDTPLAILREFLGDETPNYSVNVKINGKPYMDMPALYVMHSWGIHYVHPERGRVCVKVEPKQLEQRAVFVPAGTLIEVGVAGRRCSQPVRLQAYMEGKKAYLVNV
jgi:hypothetical protein